MIRLEIKNIRDKKVAGAIELPKKRSNFLRHSEGLSSGIWLYAPFVSANEKTERLMRVNFVCFGSMSQLIFALPTTFCLAVIVQIVDDHVECAPKRTY